MLSQLRTLGVRVALDDFGTGYSSLAYLKGLPIDELKIDRSFIKDAADSEHEAALVRAMIELGHTLGLKVVAEGVEDAATMRLLRSLRCDAVQGFYISRPVPGDALTKWARSSQLRRVA
jgi:EAL domain-containing protein (putative c-di-GMP-specific phosphodiesterase class I)